MFGTRNKKEGELGFYQQCICAYIDVDMDIWKNSRDITISGHDRFFCHNNLPDQIKDKCGDTGGNYNACNSIQAVS